MLFVAHNSFETLFFVWVMGYNKKNNLQELQKYVIWHGMESWGYSSAGRALQWHCKGQGFEPPYLHHFSDGVPFVFSSYFVA